MVHRYAARNCIAMKKVVVRIVRQTGRERPVFSSSAKNGAYF